MAGFTRYLMDGFRQVSVLSFLASLCTFAVAV